MNRIAFLLSVLLFLALSSTASAQTRWVVEEQTRVQGGAAVPILDVYATAPLAKSPFGVFAFGLVAPGWAQLYAGLSYAPASWLEFSAGAGIEQAESPWRTAGSVWMGHGRFSLLTIGEYGGSGGWYKAVANVRTTNWLGLGAMSQYGLGTGPRAQITYRKATLWGAPLFNHQDGAVSGLVGLRLGF